MKPKFEIERLKEMTYPEYLKALKKEVKRASALGRTEFVVLSDFSFKEDTDTKSALIFGEFSGKLQKFYNQQKKYRSSEKDFGRGVAYFEENVDGTTTLHLGIEAGKAKATRIKKNGKKIFKKLGLELNVYRGEGDLDNTSTEVISDEEEKANDLQVEALVKNEKIQKIQKQYINLFQQVTQLTLPKFKASTPVDSSDFDNCKKLYILSQAYQKEFETLEASEKAEYQPTLDKVLANADQVKKIYAKVKQLAMAQNPVEEDWTTVTNESLHALFEELNNLSPIHLEINNAVLLEKEEPLEPTALKSILEKLKNSLTALEKKAVAYKETEPKSFAEIEQKLQNYQKQYDVAMAQAIAFDAKRVEEEEKLKAIKQRWTQLKELEAHCEKILADKNQSKELFKYEQAIIKELLESFDIWIGEIESSPKRIKQALGEDLNYLNKEKKEYAAVLNAYKVVAHPSGKDAYYDAYVNIDQSKPASEWLESVEKLNDWLEEQEGVKEKFKEKVSLEIVHINQSNLYGISDITETDIRGVDPMLTLSTATIEQKKAALRKKNGKACKDSCDRMVSNFDKSLKVKSFALGEGIGYLSVVEEDKSKIGQIVTDSNTKIETLENDAFKYKDSANQAYNYIFGLLEKGKPIVVGVDLVYNPNIGFTVSSKKEAGYNKDKTTDHFLVITGKGEENGVPYLEYLDPGTQHGIKSKANQLYPLWKGGNMYWYDPKASWLADGTYCLSSVCLYQ